MADEEEPPLMAVMSQLRRDLGVPPGKALHWNEHVKTHERRQHVAKQLAAVPGIVVTYVIVEKTAIPVSSGIYSNHELFYNYAAAMVTERMLLAARDWPGGKRDVLVRFGHVKGFRHSSTVAYFKKKAASPSWVPWDRLRNLQFSDQATWDGLQAADQYAGMLNAAVTPDKFGGYAETHLLRVRLQLRRSGAGLSMGWGFKVLGNSATFTSLPWWPTGGL